MFDLSVPFKWFPGQIFAQDGPGRVFATNGIVTGDKLPLRGSAISVFVAIGVAARSRPERYASGNERCRELIPQQMRKWRFGVTSFAIGVSATVPNAVICLLKRICGLVIAVGAGNRGSGGFASCE